MEYQLCCAPAKRCHTAQERPREETVTHNEKLQKCTAEHSQYTGTKTLCIRFTQVPTSSDFAICWRVKTKGHKTQQTKRENKSHRCDSYNISCPITIMTLRRQRRHNITSYRTKVDVLYCALCPFGSTCEQSAWSDDVGTWWEGEWTSFLCIL